MSQMQAHRRYYNHDYEQSSPYHKLIETKSYLEKLKVEQPRVAGSFEAWRDHRKVTIKTVGDLQEKMNVLCIGCNVTRVVGAAAGIVGVFAGIIGAVLEANEHESAPQFMQTSKYCTGAGAAAIVTSTLVELGLTQSALNEITRVLEKDAELTSQLRKWIQFSHEIDHRFTQLFQCDIASDTFFSVWRVYGQCIKLLDAGSFSVQDLIRGLRFGKMEGIEDVSMEIADKVIHFLKGMLTNPSLLQPLREIWKILQENPHTFQFAKLGAIIYFKVNGLLEPGTLSKLLSVAGLAVPSLGPLLQRCVLDSIAIASNVVTFILSVKNIQEGQSKYSEALDKVKFALSSEFNDINKQMNRRVLYLE